MIILIYMYISIINKKHLKFVLFIHFTVMIILLMDIIGLLI